MQGTRAIEATVVITSGTATSNAAIIYPGQVVAVRIPAAFTGATISFTTSATESGTYTPIHNAAGLYTVAATAGKTLIVDDAIGRALGKYVKVVSALSEAADRTVTLIYRETT